MTRCGLAHGLKTSSSDSEVKNWLPRQCCLRYRLGSQHHVQIRAQIEACAALVVKLAS